jgi:hypothetical protein
MMNYGYCSLVLCMTVYTWKFDQQDLGDIKMRTRADHDCSISWTLLIHNNVRTLIFGGTKDIEKAQCHLQDLRNRAFV